MALGLATWALNACEPLARAALILGEDALKAAATRLFQLQTEVLWGAPTLILFKPSESQLPGSSIQIQPHPLPLGEIAPVLAACDLAKRLESDAKTAAAAVGSSDADGTANQGTTDLLVSSKLFDLPEAEASPDVEAEPESDESGSAQLTGPSDAPAPPDVPPLDMASLLAEATSITDLAEERWSQLQGADLSRQIQELEGRAWSVLNAIRMTASADAAENGGVVAPPFPLSFTDANHLRASSEEIPPRQRALASILAAQGLAHALTQLRVPTKTTIHLGTGSITSWWTPDAFTRVRAAATLAMQIIAPDGEPETDPDRWSLARAQHAFQAGLIEASLMYLLASLDEAEEAAGPLAGAFASLRQSVDAFIATGAPDPAAILPIALFWLHELERRLIGSDLALTSFPTDD